MALATISHRERHRTVDQARPDVVAKQVNLGVMLLTLEGIATGSSEVVKSAPSLL